jgi:hypothetical protein
LAAALARVERVYRGVAAATVVHDLAIKGAEVVDQAEREREAAIEWLIEVSTNPASELFDLEVLADIDAQAWGTRRAHEERRRLAEACSSPIPRLGHARRTLPFGTNRRQRLAPDRLERRRWSTSSFSIRCATAKHSTRSPRDSRSSETFP